MGWAAKQQIKGVGKSLGLDEEDNEREEAKRKAEMEKLEREEKQREAERQERSRKRHEEGDKRREELRKKYGLDQPKDPKTGTRPPPSEAKTEEKKDDGCIIC